MTATPNKYQIPILEKGMEVIELIAQYPEGLTIQEMVNSLPTLIPSLHGKVGLTPCLQL